MHSNPHRPEYHYTPAEAWINDPNGLVYFKNSWHLFYQYYNPEQIDGMQWGHATSNDLIAWTEHPPALSPDSLGQIWSGSAVVDERDDSGFFDGEAGLVCAFTYWNKDDHWQSQGIAYSKDGIHFTKYEGNPVIPQLRYLPGHPEDKEFRDPKLFWHKESSRWVMVVAGGKLRIFTSKNLRDWHFEGIQSDIETECPDLFPIQVEGEPEVTKWVLNGGGRWYQIGSFDGHGFHPESKRIPLGIGPDFYASQTWNNAPDNRRIMISWLFGWGYGTGLSPTGITNPFPTGINAGGCLSIPLETTLVNTPHGLRLHFKPIAELEKYRTLLRDSFSTPSVRGPVLLDVNGKVYDLNLAFDATSRSSVILQVPASGTTFYTCGYDGAAHALFIDRTHGACGTVKGYPIRQTLALDHNTHALKLRVLIDRNSIELLAQEGEHLLSAIIHPDREIGGLLLQSDSPTEMRCKVELYRVERAPTVV